MEELLWQYQGGNPTRCARATGKRSGPADVCRLQPCGQPKDTVLTNGILHLCKFGSGDVDVQEAADSGNVSVRC